jgi:uncharacterized protein with ParB-like and HNH nuclease domain
MTGSYEKAITIQKAMQNITERRYLLPAIQRKFEWDCDRICVLFDSIMRGYPINTFMLWEVSSLEIKRNFKFYEFISNYCEWFAEDNPDCPTSAGFPNFHAVIDGQQRLTSIYLGLNGSYAFKLPRRHWPQTRDDETFPPRKLYLNLTQGLGAEANESLMLYDFKFLTRAEVIDSTWFPVGEILNFADAESESDVLDIVMEELDKIGLSGNNYARQTLTKLYFKLRREALIHYYNETSQEIDHVLDIFIRTNHGGKPLSFSDLLMSITIANWQQDARQQIDNLVKDVWQSPDMGFSITRDWVLKTALAIIDADIRFRVGNFSADTVAKIEAEWGDIKACVVATFKLLHLMGLRDESLRAKNAAIPIAYYLYHKGRNPDLGRKGRYIEINNLARHPVERQYIAQWLMMSLLKGVFSGQSDTLLSKLREIIRTNLATETFPLHAIVREYKGTNKDLIFDEDFIERQLKTQKDDPMCYTILALLTPDRICTSMLHKDHLHPASAFSAEHLQQQPFLVSNTAMAKFFGNPENWNSVVNLQLLDAAQNISKQDRPLADWLENEPWLSKAMLSIPDDAPLDFPSFPEFITKRKAEMVSTLKKLGKLEQE